MSRAFIVIGLGYGDESKGSWVDHLVRKHGISHVVRFNGGAQARHHVVTPDQRIHGFAQFVSGSFVPGTKTMHSRFMLIEPETLMNEAIVLQGKGVVNPLSQMIVSENAPVITPFNRLLNQIMEIHRGGTRHGSCGLGIGLTQGDVETLKERALYVKDLTSVESFDKLVFLWEEKLKKAQCFETAENSHLVDELRHIDIGYYVQLFAHFARRVEIVTEGGFQEMIASHDVIFEGAQGVLLDQQHGFFPHCTRSNCTFENAEKLLAEAQFPGTVERIGLLRGYMTRHGAGPFVTEQNDIEVPPCLNGENPWQGAFRVGWFDAVAARYAIQAAGGVDTLAISNLDRMYGIKHPRICTEYENGDTRFFTKDSILPPPAALQTLAERTESMEQIVPIYQEYTGWKSSQDGTLRDYLNVIGDLVGTRVGAYSDSIQHHKVYL